MADKVYGKPTKETIVERLEAEQKQGYRGMVTDPTPNENYTVAGVTAHKPTPETDEKAHAKLQEAQKATLKPS